MHSAELEEVLSRVSSLPKTYFSHIATIKDKGIFTHVEIIFASNLFEKNCHLIYNTNNATLYIGDRMCEYNKPNGLIDALNSILKYLNKNN